MKTMVGFGNILLLALNLSTLGTVAYKGKLWKEAPEPQPTSLQTFDLTPSQSQAIERQRESFTRDWERIEAELQAYREELLAAVRDPRIEPSSLWPLIDEISALQGRLEKQAVSRLVQEREILSPEQREQYFYDLETRMRQGCGCMRRYRSGQVGFESPNQDDFPGRGGRGRGRGKGRGRGWRQ
jgi:Spy/CpxP family protein refolding chaperone